MSALEQCAESVTSGAYSAQPFLLLRFVFANAHTIKKRAKFNSIQAKG
jgi:hypothetical protein